MSKRKLSIQLLFNIVFLLIITLLNSWFSFAFWPFWLGGLIGMSIPFLDSLFYIYLLRPLELSSQRAKYLISKKQFRQVVGFIQETRADRGNMIIHSFLFEVVLIGLTILIITSSGSLIGLGLCMGIFLHLLVDQLSDYLANKNLNGWYLNLNQVLSLEAANKYLIVGIVIFVIFCLMI
jgi:hypothetical protein